MRLIDADTLKDYYGKWSNNHTEYLKPEIDRYIDAQPTVDAVSRGLFEQIKWERDIAMEQLEEHGIAFGAKAECAVDAVEVVRCKDCKHRVERGMCYMISGCPELVGVGDNFWCAYGERREENAAD